MKQITEMVASLVSEIQKATGLRVKTAWISPGDTIPLITLLMHDSELRPIDMSQRMLYELRFQIDIWHQSALARDKTFDSLLYYFEENKAQFHKNHGWFDIKFTGITDLEEEGVYRKIVFIRMRVIS